MVLGCFLVVVGGFWVFVVVFLVCFFVLFGVCCCFLVFFDVLILFLDSSRFSASIA